MADINSPTIAMVMRPGLFGPVVSDEAIARLKEFASVRTPQPDRPLAEQAPELLQDADGCVMCWGSPRLTADLLEHAPGLKILAYAAGSVRGVVSPELFDRGIIVTSAAAAIATEVAACALGLILCGLKGIFPTGRVTRAGGWRGEASGDVTGRTVGIIGAGHVGRRVIALLRGLPNDLKILLADPYVSAEGAAGMGVERASLEELLQRSDVVSIHVPSLPGTRHMLNASNLGLLKDGATLVNTARGSLIDPEALAAELARRPTLQALIDVTDPAEPPPADHPYRTLPNVNLTPHLAGPVRGAQARMGDLAVEELRRCFVERLAPLHPVTREMMEFVA
ncbi:MAG TPA: hydroxyacid dehydrogenase [Armatimonadota bacterium]|nr:hydroxyacid dehydrogenase [Armatimonadota bacterium]